MVIDLSDTYLMMMIMIMIMMIMMMKTRNGHNLANFEATFSGICMVIYINDTYRLYFHTKTKVYSLGSLAISNS